MTDRMLKPADVAKIFDVTKGTVAMWLRDGTLRGIKIGKGHYWRIPQSAVEELALKKYGDNDD
jgi:excisionase family DNA binding protein